MPRRLLPLAALGLLPATASALPCPPPVWWGPPVVVVYAPPRPVWFDPCWCPPVGYAVPTPATPSAASSATTAAPASPKPPPRADDTPAGPVKPVVPAADNKTVDPPTMPPLTLPTTPPPRPITPAPADPTVPKGLDLRPANPGAPDVPPLPLPLPPKETKTSFSSPLASGLSVRLVPAAGRPPAADAPRRVVFVNLSRSEVVLTVAGESAVLPARHELTATVPATFRWRLNGGEVRTAELPAAPGADVVIR